MTFKNLFSIIFLLSITACTPKAYYQVFRVKADEGMLQTKDEIAFEDEYCKITYDLWGAAGNAGFLFYNKSSQIIYIFKDETFYVQNGMANNYYKGRTITHSSSKGIAAQQGNNVSVAVAGINASGMPQVGSVNVSSKKQVVNSTGYSVSTPEEMIVAIPPQTAKYISEYYANEFVFRDCDLLQYPKRDSSSMVFGLSETPFTFSNLITYQVGKEGVFQTVSNGFHVSSITNYPATALVRSTYKEVCGKQTTEYIQVFRFTGPDMFYLKYYR